MDDSATDLGAAGFGLMFYNARWYDPLTGRFTQADSIIPNEIQGLDRYAYVNNSPIMYVDPSGHLSRDQIMELLGVSTWDEVLALFGDGGKYEGLWGLLEAFRLAEVGDHIYGCYGRPHNSRVTCYYVGDIVQGENGLTLQNPNEDNKQVSLDEIKNQGFGGFLWGRGGTAPSKLLLTSKFLDKATFAGNSLNEIDSHDHLEIDPEANPFTIFMDVLGLAGGLFGTGWLSGADDVKNLGSLASNASSLYGASVSLEPAIRGEEIDEIGLGLSAGSAFPIIGIIPAAISLIRDLFYNGP